MELRTRTASKPLLVSLVYPTKTFCGPEVIGETITVGVTANVLPNVTCPNVSTPAFDGVILTRPVSIWDTECYGTAIHETRGPLAPVVMLATQTSNPLVVTLQAQTVTLPYM